MDVLIEVANIVYPVDFVNIDVEEDKNVPLILGTPFLATAKATIKCGEGIMVLKSGKGYARIPIIPSYPLKIMEMITGGNPQAPGNSVKKKMNDWEKGLRDFMVQGLYATLWKPDKKLGNNPTSIPKAQRNPKEFLKGDKVLLYKSRIRALRGRNKPRWFGHFTVKETKLKVKTVTIIDDVGKESTVSIQRLHPFDEGKSKEGDDGNEVT